MNKKLGALGLSLMVCLLFVPAATAATCAAGDLVTVYQVPGFSCTLPSGPGTFLFSNFQSSLVSTVSVNVNPIPPASAPGVGPGEYGFLFTGGWNNTNTQDLNISFDVTGVGGALIDDIVVFFQNAGPYTGGEKVQFNETFCNSDNSKCDSISVTNPSDFSNTVLLKNTALGGPQSLIHIHKDVQFIGTGTASLSGWGNAYSAVPEPRAISLMLGLALMAAVVFFKRQRATQN